MAVDLYDLFFAGQIMQGKDPQQVRSAIARLFNADDKALARLFSGSVVKIKSAVDQDTAIRYRVTFRDAGALLDIRPATIRKATPTPAPSGDTSTEQPGTTELQLLPPMTGTLLDCATPVDPAPIPDISAITLAPQGAPIDASKPAPTLAVNTDHLSLAPAATGTLEDYRIVSEPEALPDISGMKLVD